MKQGGHLSLWWGRIHSKVKPTTCQSSEVHLKATGLCHLRQHFPMAAVICRQSILNNSWPDYARLALAEARDSIETNYFLWECAITCLVGAKVWFQCHDLLASPIHNLVLDLRNCWTNWMKSACPADITAAGVIGDFFGLDYIYRVPFQKVSQHID